MDAVVMFAWQTLLAAVGFGLGALVLAMAAWGVVMLIGFVREEVRYWR